MMVVSISRFAWGCAQPIGVLAQGRAGGRWGSCRRSADTAAAFGTPSHAAVQIHSLNGSWNLQGDEPSGLAVTKPLVMSRLSSEIDGFVPARNACHRSPGLAGCRRAARETSAGDHLLGYQGPFVTR